MEKIGDILPWLERAYAIGLRDKHIIDLSGISAGTMSRAKNGTDPLHGQDWLDAKNLVLDCEELARRNSVPINWTDLRAIRLELDALHAERRNPPAPPTEADYEILGATTPESLALLAEKRGIPLSVLISSIDESMKRFDFVIHGMRKSSAELRDLTTLRSQELEGRRAK